jgi:hypothetical protein
MSALTRHDVETLLLLNALGPEGALPVEVAPRLGLSTSLAAAVGVALASLEGAGFVSTADGRYVRTEAGSARLHAYSPE